MRIISKKEITEIVKQMYIKINQEVRTDYLEALKKAYKDEPNVLPKKILRIMLENYEIAKNEKMPICQDTGYPIFFVKFPTDIKILDGNIYDAINDGVRQATKDGYLRASIVQSPIERKNTQDNTPAIIHLELIDGENIIIDILAKGGGSENKSKLFMLTPNEGVDGVKRVVIETVKIAGPDACPPFVVGVGIGGTFDKCAELAKKALTREINSENPDSQIAKLEKELLQEINKLGIGPQGLGGKTSCVGVFIESHPCHIASLPVAVNIQCNANRHIQFKI